MKTFPGLCWLGMARREKMFTPDRLKTSRKASLQTNDGLEPSYLVNPFEHLMVEGF